jgi:glycosyltransferase involved in cell wall biosynthesis
VISIVINNFNYGRYLGAAIESALSQTHTETEVLVVDDGSTDDSRSVIARYGGIRTILKSNGGQPSAFNAGFAESTGEIVIFLDADDLLLPETAARVAAEFRRDPRLVKVQYRLEIVDAEGRPIGRTLPSGQRPLAAGDLRKTALISPDDLAYAPTSGNAFSAAALRRLLPVPEVVIYADLYVVNLVALLGPIGSIDGIGGRYRVHGRNALYTDSLDLERVRATIERTEITHRHLVRFAGELGLITNGTQPRLQSVTNLAQRLMSLRLDPAHHPVPADNRLGLGVRGAAVALRRRDLPVRSRLAYGLWFATTALAPRSVAHALSKGLFSAWRS